MWAAFRDGPIQRENLRENLTDLQPDSGDRNSHGGACSQPTENFNLDRDSNSSVLDRGAQSREFVDHHRIASSMDQVPRRNHISPQPIEAIFLRVAPDHSDTVRYKAPRPILNHDVAKRKHSRLFPEIERVDNLRVTRLHTGDAPAPPA